MRLNDSKNLLSAWCREAGRVTFAIPAGSSREARRRRAITAPLCAFEGVADIKPERDILSVRDVMPMPGSLAMNASPTVTMTAMFLAEVLDRLLGRSAADDELSDFLFESIERLGRMSGRDVANFHVVFLYALTHYAGIGPDVEDYHRGSVFDMREGRFRASSPMHGDVIEGDEARALMLISRTPIAHAGRIAFTADSRNRALDLLLRYYSIHLTPLSNLKSLEILREL